MTPSTEGKLREALWQIIESSKPIQYDFSGEGHEVNEARRISVMRKLAKEALSTPSQPVEGNEEIFDRCWKAEPTLSYEGAKKHFVEAFKAKDAEKAVVQAMLDGTERAAEKLKKENSELREELAECKKFLNYENPQLIRTIKSLKTSNKGLREALKKVVEIDPLAVGSWGWEEGDMEKAAGDIAHAYTKLAQQALEQFGGGMNGERSDG